MDIFWQDVHFNAFMKANLDEQELWNRELETLDALGRIDWAWKRFGSGLMLSTSFGLQSAVMIHLVRQVSESIPIVFIDTGYLFPGTYQYALTLQKKFSFNARIYSAGATPSYQEAAFGKLWEQGKNGMKKYNFLNKKEPMGRALKELGISAWMAGLRRSHSHSREELSFLEKQDNVIKVYPILDWDDRTTYQYLPKNDLPYHPLEGLDYESLGDWHTTRKLSEVKHFDDTRHGGHGRECGLHDDLPEGLDFTV